jgi:Zn-finger nucleic acid-binding protein
MICLVLQQQHGPMANLKVNKMDTDTGTTCDLCRTFYPFVTCGEWKGDGIRVVIPDTDVAFALVEVNGVEMDICEKCYFADLSLAEAFPTLERELVAGFGMQDRWEEKIRVLRNWMKKKPNESSFYSCLAGILRYKRKHRWADLALERAREIYQENEKGKVRDS